MASNTDTLPVETGEAMREESRPPSARGGALIWAAVIGACILVAALVVVILSGGDDDGDIPATRVDPQAEVAERQAHLDGQATTYGRDSAVTAPSQAANLAVQQAERIERQAHLEGQARTYGQPPAGTSDTPAPAADEPGPEFLPGSRHVPTR